MYHGGKTKGKAGRPGVGDKKKIPVVGIAERGTSEKAGRIVARVAKDVKQETLHGLVREYVLPKSTVYTDELNSYHGLAGIHKIEPNEDGKPEWKPMGYQHRRINHSSGVYVNGDVHTNTIEGFWSLIKRGLGGTHHAVSQKFLQEYLNEYSFRYNRRDVPTPMFKLILEQVSQRAR
jgi:transposase